MVSQQRTCDFGDQSLNSGTLFSHLKKNFNKEGNWGWGVGGRAVRTNKQGLPWQPVVKTPHFHCRAAGSIPDQRTKIPHVAWSSQKIKKLKIIK